jgi:hypothetical protein
MLKSVVMNNLGSCRIREMCEEINHGVIQQNGQKLAGKITIAR